MLVAERHTKILDLLNLRGSIRVAELSQFFKVTEETIRRDLDFLESEGKLRRSHGGAVRVQEEQQEIHYGEREIQNVAEKMIIAQEAIKSIYPNDRILLDASSTAWYMAQILPDIPLTVFTNSIKVAMELSGKEKIQVISTGGILLPRSLSYVGPLAVRSLDQYHFSKAFISCKGVDLHRGISDSNEMQALIKQKMIACADRVFLMVDHTKFGEKDFAHIADLSEIDVIVTDGKADQRYIHQFQETMEVIQIA